METSFYTREELSALGLASCGEDVLISRNARLYGPERISFGDHVRVDDFCVLSGSIHIGSHVHISAGCCLFAGEAGIVFEDYTSLSSRCAVYAVSDDYSGEFLVNPTVANELRNVIAKEVVIEQYSVIGTGCTVLPGVKISEGCAVGAMGLLNRNTEPWGIYIGVPCRRIKERSKMCLTELEKYATGGGTPSKLKHGEIFAVWHEWRRVA